MEEGCKSKIDLALVYSRVSLRGTKQSESTFGGYQKDLSDLLMGGIVFHDLIVIRKSPV